MPGEAEGIVEEPVASFRRTLECLAEGRLDGQPKPLFFSDTWCLVLGASST